MEFVAYNIVSHLKHVIVTSLLNL